MASITTQALVLRHADYREHDRMLTLLSPAKGRIDALCRGCKRMGSPLLAASEWFTLGEYVLFASKNKLTVSACHVTESFYPLRTDYDKLRYATYLLSIAEIAAQPGERAVELFTLLARSLSRLSYTEMDMQAVTAAFLLHFASISGYRPRLSHCVQCGRRLENKDIIMMDIEAGGLICPDCRSPLTPVHPVNAQQVEWMKEVLLHGIDKCPLPESLAPGSLLADYVEARLEKKVRRTGLFL